MDKGTQGYIRRQKKKGIVRSLIGISLVLLIYQLGIHVAGTNKNYATVVAVLFILPTAQILAKHMVYVKYKSIQLALKDILEKAGGTYLVELVMICGKKQFFLKVVRLEVDKICCWVDTSHIRYTLKDIQEELEDLFLKKGQPIQVIISPNLESCIKEERAELALNNDHLEKIKNILLESSM